MSESWQKFCNEAPMLFYANVSTFLETMEPSHDHGALSDLSKEIWDKFTDNKQTRKEIVKKMFLWMQLKRCTNTEFPNHGLLMAGSTLNGFGLKNSDVDFSFISNEPTTDQQICLETLEKLLNTLKQEYVQLTQSKIIPASVLLLKFQDTQFDLNVDINCSSVSNIKNTYLLYLYSQIDWRLKPLAVVIKLWAKHKNILNSNYSCFSSYPLMLMLINFLQSIKPPVLPNLQEILDDKFKQDVEKLDFFEKVNIPFETKNRQSLEELLTEFFKYYSCFGYERSVISVRKGQVVPLLQYKIESSCQTTSYSKGYIFIEEPFHLENVGRSVRTFNDFEKFLSALCISYTHIIKEKKLDSIFDKSIA